MNEDVVQAMGVSKSAVEKAVATELEELHRREFAYHGYIGTPEIKGMLIILVDDGIATGATVRAAVQVLRQRQVAQIVIAVPVSSTDARAMLKPMVDDFVALACPENFRAVGQWYENFYQTTDAEVIHLLAQAAGTQPHVKGTS